MGKRMFLDYAALQSALNEQKPAGKRPPAGCARHAVCLLLFDDRRTQVLLIQKADHEGYPWRDQIALPGGRIEPSDESAEAAALRELHEELGIPRSAVDVLGNLGHYQTQGSNNDLEVFAAHWRHRSTIHPDPREIARVIECPLHALIGFHEQAGYRHESGERIAETLAYPVGGAEAWGVTARILHSFIEHACNHDLIAFRP